MSRGCLGALAWTHCKQNVFEIVYIGLAGGLGGLRKLWYKVARKTSTPPKVFAEGAEGGKQKTGAYVM